MCSKLQKKSIKDMTSKDQPTKDSQKKSLNLKFSENKFF